MTDVAFGVLDTGDSRRFEVVVDVLPLHRGVQLALDTTLVSSVLGDGSPEVEPPTLTGGIAPGEERLVNTFPELMGSGARARWSVEAKFLWDTWQKFWPGGRMEEALQRDVLRCGGQLEKKRRIVG